MTPIQPKEPFPYSSATYEKQQCNLCGGSNSDVLETRDRNGLPVTSCICRGCGLIFINPRMTAQWYEEYYKYEYRRQMARFRGRIEAVSDLDTLFNTSKKHGATLATQLRSQWPQGLTIEVGSSAGGVLSGIQEVLGVEVLGIEPSPEEAEYANGRGIRTHTAAIESFSADVPKAAAVLCTQSLNHFLNPRYFFEWAYRALSTEGILILEVMNFRHVFKRFGWMPRAIQIDHTFMFVPEVLSDFVTCAGFDVVHLIADENLDKESLRKARKAGSPGLHITIVARKSARQPFQGVCTNPQRFTEVRASIDRLPNRKWLYMFRHGFKKWRKTGIA